jgi:hypothetical protein
MTTPVSDSAWVWKADRDARRENGAIPVSLLINPYDGFFFFQSFWNSAFIQSESSPGHGRSSLHHYFINFPSGPKMTMNGVIPTLLPKLCLASSTLQLSDNLILRTTVSLR